MRSRRSQPGTPSSRVPTAHEETPAHLFLASCACSSRSGRVKDGDSSADLRSTFKHMCCLNLGGSMYYVLCRSLRACSVEISRSEERRVGKEGRSRWSPYH